MKRLIRASESVPNLGEYAEFYRWADSLDIHELGDDESKYTRNGKLYIHQYDRDVLEENGLIPVGLVIAQDHCYDDLSDRGLEVSVAAESNGIVQVYEVHSDRVMEVSLEELQNCIPGYGLEPDEPEYTREELMNLIMNSKDGAANAEYMRMLGELNQ